MAAADMHRKCWYFFWLLGFCGLVTAVEEVTTPEVWLQRMASAMRNLNYAATAVYSRDNRIRSLALSHVVQGDVIHERLQSLDGPRRKVIRAAERVSCYLPDRGLVIVESRPPDQSLFANALPEYWAQQTRFYRLQTGKRERVAGREAREIVLQPLDGYRYGRRVWIDAVTFLPLKFELFDRTGNVLESLVIVQLQVGSDVQPEASDVDGDWKVLDRREVAAGQDWKLTFLPPGFHEVRRSRHLDLTDGQPVDHILISDGWASVSVYVKPDGDARFDPGSLRLGAVNIYNHRFDDHLVTVLGDVPPITVQKIGEGLTRGQP